MSFRSILSIFLLLTIASPAPGNPVVGPTYGDILFELGYDPGSGRSSDDLACRRIEMVYEFSRLVDHHTEADPKLASTYREPHTMLSSLDAGNLYDLLPYTDATGQRRAIGMSGRTQMNSYQLKQYDPDGERPSILSINTDGGLPNDLKRFGDMNFRAYIKPVIQNQYKFLTDSQPFTADLSAVIIPRIISGLMTVVWHPAGRREDPSVDLGARFSSNHKSLQVLAGFALEFPEFFNTVTQYFIIENVVSSQTRQQEGSQSIDLRVRIKREAVAEKYPEMGEMLEILKGMVYFKGRIFDDQNRLMGLVELDSANDFFQVPASGNEGQGRRIEMVSLQPTPSQNILQIGAGGEVLANGTIKLGFRLQRQFAAKHKQLIAELKAFKEQLWTAFYRDYQTIKHGRGCQ